MDNNHCARTNVILGKEKKNAEREREKGIDEKSSMK